MIPLLLRFKSYLIILAVLSALFGWGMWERSGKLSIKAEYDTFIIKAQILAAERLAENQRKEAEYRERLKTAEFARDRLMRELRQRRENSSLSGMSLTPESATNRVCFNRTKLESAFRILVTDLQGIAEQGDIALIDLQTVLAGWPAGANK